LDIRNSPLNRFATLGAKALLCFKSACVSALLWTVGLTLGIMLGTDEILHFLRRKMQMQMQSSRGGE